MAVAAVIVDIKRKVVNVIESQTFAEVCLVKSRTTLNTIIAVVDTDEITGNSGSPREPTQSHLENRFIILCGNHALIGDHKFKLR